MPTVIFHFILGVSITGVSLTTPKHGDIARFFLDVTLWTFLDVVTSSLFHQTRGVWAASDLEVYLHTSNYIGVFRMSLLCFSDMSVRSE